MITKIDITKVLNWIKLIREDSSSPCLKRVGCYCDLCLLEDNIKLYKKRKILRKKEGKR